MVDDSEASSKPHSVSSFSEEAPAKALGVLGPGLINTCVANRLGT